MEPNEQLEQEDNFLSSFFEYSFVDNAEGIYEYVGIEDIEEDMDYVSIKVTNLA